MLEESSRLPAVALSPIEIADHWFSCAGTKVTKGPEEEEADRAAKAEFDRLTEAASTLMDVGELNVYSQKREDFELEAAKYLCPFFVPFPVHCSISSGLFPICSLEISLQSLLCELRGS